MKKINSETLYELINDGTIKANTKMRVYKDDVYITTITFDGYDFIWETGTFSSGMLFNPLCDFEIIKEDKKIEKLERHITSQNYMIENENTPMEEKMKLVRKLIYDSSIEINIVKDKINELIYELNKLKVSK